MTQRIGKVLSLPYRLRQCLELDSQAMETYRYFQKAKHLTSPHGDIVLVECVEDLYFFSLLGQVISSLRAERSIHVDLFVADSLRAGESARSILYFMRTRIVAWLLSKRWVNLYQSLCDNVGYRSASMQFPLGDLIDGVRALACWRSLSNKEALISLAIDKVPVGDLVNDSYIRFKPAPTVNLEDPYLWYVIWQAYRDVRRAKHYFGGARPKLYLTTYSTYIQHGIAVRVALQHGVTVFGFASYVRLAKELTLGDWSQVGNPDSYAADFRLLGNQDQRLAEAEAALAARVSGVIDSATAYMKISPYVESGDPVPNVRGAIVVYLHDFFDSPHIYRHMVFPDFWEWICFTIETLEKANIRFFVKPHPNQIELNDRVLSDLKSRYPNLLIISSNVSNKQLVEAGMACAVTVYGTVAHEMAYLGVPTIACGDNPHVSFNFCNTCRSKTEYADALCRYAEIQFDKWAMHRESLMFYYMHVLSASAEEKTLILATLRLYQLCHDSKSKEEDLSDLLTSISELRGFKAYIAKLAEALKRKELV